MDAVIPLYLDLMKRCLTNWIYGPSEQMPYTPTGPLETSLAQAYGAHGVRLMRDAPYNREHRTVGHDWPPYAHTMAGLKRLDNVQFCVEDVIRSRVPGDLIETGVWRGGSCIFMRAILKAYGDRERTVWLADSFAGLPPPDESRYPADKGDILYTFPQLAVSEEQVRANFAQYDLLDDQVRFLKGWFRDTLPTAPLERIAVLRLDGDMYESTMDALVNLYPKVSVGGYVIVDDYGCIPACRQAIHDYRDQHGITDEIHEVDWTGVFWRRS